MKQIILSFFLFFSLIPASQAQFWVPCYATPDSSYNLTHYSRHECGAVTANIDGHRMAILLGGRSGSGQPDKKRPVIYDFDANSLTMGQTINKQLHHFQAAVWRDSIVVVGMSFDLGYPNEVPHSHLYYYYIRSNTWVTGDTVPTARARGSAQCVVVDDTAYFFSGLTNGHKSGWVTWVDKYDLVNGVWDTLSPAPRARDHAVALLEGDNIYLVGGRRSNAGGAGLHAYPVAEIDVYHLPTDTWSTLPVSANLPDTRGGLQAVMSTNTALNPQINLWGGELNADTHITGLGLDLVTNTWNTLPDLVAPVHASAICPISADTLVMMAGAVRLPNNSSPEYVISDSFYVQVYYGTPTLLPIPWLAAGVEEENGQLHFSWQVNVPGPGRFAIQRETGQGQWQNLGFAAAQENNSLYEWVFSAQFSGEQRYRIHLQLQDGTQSFSPDLSLSVVNSLDIYPNPVSLRSPSVMIPAGQVEKLELFSVNGQLLDVAIRPVEWTLPTSISPGTYLLRLSNKQSSSTHELKVVE